MKAYLALKVLNRAVFKSYYRDLFNYKVEKETYICINIEQINHLFSMLF